MDARSEGLVSVTFDDSSALQWNGFKITKLYGVPGTMFVTIDSVDTEWGLSWNQLREMYKTGWEIGSHTDTHPDLTAITNSELLRYQLVYPKYRIAYEIGEMPISFASPFGRYDEKTVAEISKHYSLHLNAWSDGWETDGRNMPDVDPLNISRIDVGEPNINPEDVCRMIDEAAERNHWLVLLFHGISIHEPAEYQMRADAFEVIMSCLKQHMIRGTVRALTVREAFKALNPSSG